jgi:hypothetical protein
MQQQFTLQARGERLGATTWRALAAQAQEEGARTTFLQCAQLEEESGDYLEGLLRAAPRS